MNFAALLLALAGPIARQVLLALGIGLVTYVGVGNSLALLLDEGKIAWGGIPSSVAAMLALAGAPTALALIAGAMIARVTLMSLKRLIPK